MNYYFLKFKILAIYSLRFFSLDQLVSNFIFASSFFFGQSVRLNLTVFCFRWTVWDLYFTSVINASHEDRPLLLILCSSLHNLHLNLPSETIIRSSHCWFGANWFGAFEKFNYILFGKFASTQAAGQYILKFLR